MIFMNSATTDSAVSSLRRVTYCSSRKFWMLSSLGDLSLKLFRKESQMVTLEDLSLLGFLSLTISVFQPCINFIYVYISWESHVI